MNVRIETQEERWARERALHVHIVKQGLQAGLTKFFGRATRAALIYSVEQAASDDFIVYDTTGLLDEHRSAIQTYFSTPSAIPTTTRITKRFESIEEQVHISDNLLCFIHQSDRVFFHMWLIELHPSESPSSVVEQWVKLAELPLLYKPEEPHSPPFGASGRLAEHAGFDVIREVIMREMYPRTLPGGQFDAELALESLLEIASVKEEGVGCSGTIALFDRRNDRQPIVDYPFQQPISIDKFKHIRKLLTSTSEDYQLVCVAGEVVGLSHKGSLNSPLLATFKNGRATLSLTGKPLCRLLNGNFRAVDSTWSIQLQQAPDAISLLPQPKQKQIFSLVDELVTRARTEKFGCTVVIDCGDAASRQLSGQKLAQPVVLDATTFKLLADMSKVDGAVHIDASSLTLQAFACLLDGDALPQENLSRGARFNSAARFSNKAHDVIVVVVSEDGPVTIFEKGSATASIEKYVRDYQCKDFPPNLKDWLSKPL